MDPGRPRIGASWARKPPPVPGAGKASSPPTKLAAAALPSLFLPTQAAAPQPALRQPTAAAIPLDARTVLVTPTCPPQLVAVRDVRVPWSLPQFELQRLLGSGKTSNVYQAMCVRSGVSVALKIYPKKSLSPLNLLQVQREQAIHSRLSHAHVLDLYAVFEDADAFYFVMQFIRRGDLFHELKRSGGCFSEKRCVRDVLVPTLRALAYMHSEGVIHRDVKPENTLVGEDGGAILADFGLSMDCGLERPATRLGTLDYMAPEVLRCPDKEASAPPGPQLYDGKVDAWAVGVLAFEVLVGRAPFEQECKQTTCDLICYGDFALPPFLSPSAKDFISAALCKSTAARPSIAELLDHPWVAGEARRSSGAAALLARITGMPRSEKRPPAPAFGPVTPSKPAP